MSVTAKAIWYIESHLDGDLSLDAIAASAGISKFHLSRVFPIAAGIDLASYIRARRLSEAARALASGAAEILPIALAAGYNSHEAFTRAFRAQFGLTPSAARTQPLQLQEPIRLHPSQPTALAKPRFAEADAILIFGLSKRYTAAETPSIPLQWNAFVPHIGRIAGQVGMTTYGVVCNPDSTGAIEYISGVAVNSFPSQPIEFARLRIPPQRYAVFEHTTHVSNIGDTWRQIWDSDLAVADGPSFEKYGERFDGRTGLGGFEIWVPVRY